jgi:hypothetical protein
MAARDANCTLLTDRWWEMPAGPALPTRDQVARFSQRRSPVTIGESGNRCARIWKFLGDDVCCAYGYSHADHSLPAPGTALCPGIALAIRMKLVLRRLPEEKDRLQHRRSRSFFFKDAILSQSTEEDTP